MNKPAENPWKNIADMGYMFGEHAGSMGQALVDLGYRDAVSKKPTPKAFQEKLCQAGLTKAYLWNVEKVSLQLQMDPKYAGWHILPEQDREGVMYAKRMISILNELSYKQGFSSQSHMKNFYTVFKNAIGALDNQTCVHTARVTLAHLEKAGDAIKPSVWKKLKALAPQHVLDRYCLDDQTLPVHAPLRRVRL